MPLKNNASVAIAVPVRNEVDLLPALLQALSEQRGAPPFTLCLFFDGCSDGSDTLATAAAVRLPYPLRTASCPPGDAANAGRARAAAMKLALAAAPDGILLSTDADCVPAPDWIAANLVALADADVVAGRIVRDHRPPAPRQDRIDAYFARLHQLRRAIDPVPWDTCPTHHWTSAASLALSAGNYRTLGGFATVANGEDALLCDDAARCGLRVRRDARVTVGTSARRDGRAACGLATALAAHDRQAPLPQVSHPDDEAWRFRLHAQARAQHGSADYRNLADLLGLPLGDVEQVAAECCNGEAFAARIVGVPPHGMRMVSLDRAEQILSGLEQGRLRGAA